MRPSNTIVREEILQVLKESETPLDTSGIHKLVMTEADLVTIYRGLEYLEKQNLISSFSFACEKSRIKKYYIYKSTKHCHFLHCERCHNFSPITHCEILKSIKDIEEEYNCVINSHHLSYTGICSACR